MKNASHVYAIIRCDDFLDDCDIKSKITVKMIVQSFERADLEVKRLNSLNADKGCRYFWQLTRLVHEEDSGRVNPFETPPKRISD